MMMSNEDARDGNKEKVKGGKERGVRREGGSRRGREFEPHCFLPGVSDCMISSVNHNQLP